MKLKLTYQDPLSQQQKEVVVNTPVAIGCDTDYMPDNVDRVVIDDLSIYAYHANIKEKSGELKVKIQHNNKKVPINNNQFTLGTIKITLEILQEDSGRCQRMVGFLFKRKCDRLDSNNCPYCNNGTSSNDHDSDYSYYQDYGTYSTWGSRYYQTRNCYYYDSNNRSVEFTEADNRAFEAEYEQDFEQNFSAS